MTKRRLMTTIAQRVAQAKGEILEDVRTKVVPRSVRTFSQLHDYVDANQYGGGFDDDVTVEDLNEVQTQVGAWISAGGHKEVA
jgi:hypothetical protein